MKEQNQIIILREKTRNHFQKAKKVVDHTYFKIFFLGLFLFFISQKNFSIQFNMNTDANVHPKDKEAKSNGQTQSGFLETASFIDTSSKKSKRAMSKKEQAAYNKKMDYVKRFESLAVAEMKKYGIPASITLAQGILESGIGESKLSRENNNHFGIKCFSKKCPKNHCSNFNDDHHKDFFKKYDSPWHSFRDHSELLMNKRYRHLLKEGRNYKAWAFGLKKAGYATSPTYAEKLIALIESLSLQKYDR